MLYLRNIFLLLICSLVTSSRLIGMDFVGREGLRIHSSDLQRAKNIICSYIQKSAQRAFKQPDLTIKTAVGITKLSVPAGSSIEEISQLFQSMNDSLTTFKINLKNPASAKAVKKCTIVVPNRAHIIVMKNYIVNFPALKNKAEIIVAPLPKEKKFGSFMMSIEFDDKKKDQQARL